LNGISGIGTGFSCDVPSYNPLTIVEYLRNKLRPAASAAAPVSFIPYYEGFKGTVEQIGDQKYLIRGKYEKVAENKYRITELPVGTWTMPYLTYLEGLLDGGVDKAGKKLPPVLKDMTNLSTEITVDITVQFPKGTDLSEAALEKILKLTTTVSTTNMHLFDAECKLHKYATVEEIIDDFFVTRLKTYQKRKDAMICEMRAVLVKLSNRARYILDVLSGTVDLRKKTNQQVVELLEGMKYDKIEGEYKYLVKMPMDSVTEEHVAKILKEKADTDAELATLIATSPEQIWLRELDTFEIQYKSAKTLEKKKVGKK
jgi:DNA topoisomerase-2